MRDTTAVPQESRLKKKKTILSPGDSLKHDFKTALGYFTKYNQVEMLNLNLFIAIFVK
jgi:hypothetical protein